MAEAKKITPISDLPINLYRPMSGEGDHLALINAGSMHFTFLAPTAMEAKRRAREWASKHSKAKPKDATE